MRLLSTRTLTIKMVAAAKGKNIPLPKTLNQSTGKVSARQTGFNDAAWGEATRLYATSIQNGLPDDKFQKVMDKASELAKKSRSNHNFDTVTVTNVDQVVDPRALLVADSSSEPEPELELDQEVAFDSN